MIYLDYSAHTPADPRVLEAFCSCEKEYTGNPNSKHASGRFSNEALSRVTQSTASVLGADPSEIIYTSGASEANNLAIKGVARASRHIGKHIVSSALEHPSVSAPLTYLQEQGYEIDLVDIGRDGKIDTEHLRSLMRRDTVLVTLCAVDSELGSVQPIKETANILREYPNCRLHVDATQAVGKIPIDLEGIDTLSLSAHKFYGLTGIGLLYKKKGIVIEPLIHGGAGATIYRSGTPALSLAASLDTALNISLSEMNERYAIVREKNTALRSVLSAYTGVTVNSPKDAVPHILNVSVRGVKGGDFQKALDEKGVCVSVKSACSVEGTPSRTVFAVSRDRKNALSSWRISISHLTTNEEIEMFADAFGKCYMELVK